MLSDGAGAVLAPGPPQCAGLSLRIDWINVHLLRRPDAAACMYAGAEWNERD